MKVLVTYLSKTGNTKRVAGAISEGIEDAKETRPIEQVDSLEGYDIAFLGFPIHKEGPDRETVRLLEKHCVNGRNIVLFITHASREDSPDLPPMLAKFKQAARSANVIATFDCQGELAKAVKIIMTVYPNAKYRRWAKQDDSQGQPDKTRLDRARAFSRDVMSRFHDNQSQPEKVLTAVF